MFSMAKLRPSPKYHQIFRHQKWANLHIGTKYSIITLRCPVLIYKSRQDTLLIFNRIQTFGHPNHYCGRFQLFFLSIGVGEMPDIVAT